MKTKTIALAVVYAALYASLVIVLAPISYGPLNVRIADAMVALVPLFGWAGVVGQALGVFISNIFSPLGWIDLLNTIPSFIMAFVIWKLKNRSVIAGTVMYSIVLGGTVGAMLSYVYGLPLIAEFFYVLIGNLIASTVIGYPLYRAIKKTNLHRWLETGT
jgi:uncharacterized membrane protein